jgi:hypothetical protein
MEIGPVAQPGRSFSKSVCSNFTFWFPAYNPSPYGLTIGVEKATKDYKITAKDNQH